MDTSFGEFGIRLFPDFLGRLAVEEAVETEITFQLKV